MHLAEEAEGEAASISLSKLFGEHYEMADPRIGEGKCD